MFTTWADRAGILTRHQQTRHAARDRAYIAMLLWAQARPSPGLPQFGMLAPQELHPAFRAIRQVGQVQEIFLLRLADLFDCIGGYVELTKDTRVIRSEVDGFVHSLHGFAQLWSALEFDLLADRIPEERWRGRLAAALNGAATLFDRADRLQDHLTQEIDSAFPPPPFRAIGCQRVPPGLLTLVRRALLPLEPDFVLAWNALAPSAASAGDNNSPIPQAGTRGQAAPPFAPPRVEERNPPLAEGVRALIDSEADSGGMRRLIQAGGAAPYLALAAAYSVGATGAHGSAIDVLMAWLDQREQLEQRLRARQPAGGRTRVSQEALMLAALSWYRLQVAVEVVLLTSSAEKSGEAMPVSPDAMGILLREIFPPVLKAMGENEALTQWRRSNLQRHCETAEYRWKQAFVSSYLSFTEVFMKLRNTALTRPSDVTVRDVETAQMLIDIEPACFGDIEQREMQRLNQSARNVAASAILINALVDPDRRAYGDRMRLAETLDDLLRTVINQTERGAEAKDDHCLRRQRTPRAEFELACQLSRSNASESAMAANARSLKAVLDLVRRDVR